MNHISVSKEVGKYCHSNRNVYDILDTVLFGSVAKNIPNPKDVDILVIHNNSAFDKVQKIHDNDGCVDDIQRFQLLDKILQEHDYPSVKGVMSNNVIADAISRNLLNLRYLHKNFFHDTNYFADEISRNMDPKFFDNLFDYGLLWNPDSERYDIPINKKYSLLKNEHYKAKACTSILRERSMKLSR